MGLNNETFQLTVSEVDGVPTEVAVRRLIFPNNSLIITDAGEVQVNFVVGVGGSITLTGDVTGTGTGTIATTIPADSIDFAQIQNIATDRLLGRSTASTGDVEQILVGAGLTLQSGELALADSVTVGEIVVGHGGLVLSDSDGSHGLIVSPGSNLTATRTLSIATGDSNRTLTLTGNASIEGTNTGDQTFADIVTANSIGADELADDAVTFDKIQNISTDKLLGRFSSGSGDVEQVSLSSFLIMSGGFLTLDLGAEGWGFGSLDVNYGGFGLMDSDSGQKLIVRPDSNLTANRTLSIVTGDANRAITLNGDLSYPVPTAGIVDDAVTFAKMQNISTARLLGRTSASSGDVEQISVGSGLLLESGSLVLAGTITVDQITAEVASIGYSGLLLLDSDGTQSLTIRPVSNITTNCILTIDTGNTSRVLSLTGDDVTISGTHSGTSSGTNTGDQTIILTGAVTGSGTGSFATTLANTIVGTANIVNDAVTFAKMQNISTEVLLGRYSASSGNVEEVTLGPDFAFSSGALIIDPAASIEVDEVTAGNFIISNEAFGLILASGDTFTASRTLNITTNDANRTLTLSGNPTLSDWFDQSVKVAASPKFTKLSINTSSNSAQIEIVSATSGSQDLGRMTSYSANAFGPIVRYRKARGTEGSPAIVVNGDICGEFPGQGWDGDQFLTVADFSMEVDGTPADNNVPGRLVFYTSPANGIVERMRIDSKGNVTVGTAALATTATDGFLYIPTCAGLPTGVPTTKTGRAPLIYDTTNNHLYIYNGGWKKTTVFA